MRFTYHVRALLALLALLYGTACHADVRLNALFADGMVLQQGMKVPVWGSAEPGEVVTVLMQNQKAKVIAKDGKWIVWLSPLSAGGPFEMTVEGKNKLCVKNVLVGEVWLCSGQSNMSWTLAQSADPQEAIEHADDPLIRLFTVPRKVSMTPMSECGGTWEPCSPRTARRFSAVGYYFGRRLARELRVPIGLVQSTWGGTIIEAWTSRAALAAIGVNEENLSHNAASSGLADLDSPAVLYNAMITPLAPMAFRGIVWYQGESNTSRPFAYGERFPALIENWRRDWRRDDLPFLFVQLAPFKPKVGTISEGRWAELREAQLLTYQSMPRTAMAVITDLGDPNEVHPRRKEPVAERLFVAALAMAYGSSREYSGPIFDQMRVEGNKAVVSFTHLGGGLVAKGTLLQGFTIAGSDRRFVEADAVIEGDQVVVSGKEVDQPAAVRFGWADYPVVNLWNKAGLPASPFRTDKWQP
jgi:sialate O-acetylesterase